MNLDRDLRDALQPLRGDPVEDARAVLASLPGGDGGAARPRGPRSLPIAALLLGVLAVGVVVGIALDSAFGGPAGGRAGAGEGGPEVEGGGDPPPPEDPEPEDPKPEDPKPDEKKDKHDKSDPWSEPDGLLLMAFGEVAVNEPKQTRETLAPGGWRVAVGTMFETGDSLAGLFVYGNGAAIRFGQQTVGTVDRDRITLRAGRLWLSTVNQPTAVRIEAELATVLSNGAEVMVDRAANGAAVTVLAGSATVRASGGESRRIEAMRRCEIDATGMLGEVEDVPFAGTITGWMAPMILKQQDDRELHARVAEMVEAYVEGRYRDAAEFELRKLGSSAVSKLFGALDGMADDGELRHRTARLIGDLADYTLKDWLFAMLDRGDEETRAIAYRALVRVSRTEVEDEAFWRAATAADREIQLRRWRALLR